MFNHKTSEQLQALTKVQILDYWETTLTEQLKSCYLVDKNDNFVAYIYVKGIAKSYKKDLMIERTLNAQEKIVKHYKGVIEEVAPVAAVEDIDTTTFDDYQITELSDSLYNSEIYTIQEMTIPYLKSELKEYRALGHEVKVKLNKKHSESYRLELQAEYDRLEVEINGVRSCKLSSDVLGFESEGLGYGWYGCSCELPTTSDDDNDTSDQRSGKLASKSLQSTSKPSIAHSFMAMYRATIKKQSKRVVGFGQFIKTA